MNDGKGLYGGAVMVIGGALMMSLGLRAGLEERAARAWREVPATVLDARIESEPRIRSDRDYVLRVRYRFELSSGPYEGTRFRIGDAQMTRDEARAELAALAPGTRTTALYDPQDPTDSALRRGGTGEASARLGGLWIAGFGFLCVGVWQWRRSQAPSGGDRIV